MPWADGTHQNLEDGTTYFNETHIAALVECGFLSPGSASHTQLVRAMEQDRKDKAAGIPRSTRFEDVLTADEVPTTPYTSLIDRILGWYGWVAPVTTGPRGLSVAFVSSPSVAISQNSAGFPSRTANLPPPGSINAVRTEMESGAPETPKAARSDASHEGDEEQSLIFELRRERKQLIAEDSRALGELLAAYEEGDINRRQLLEASKRLLEVIEGSSARNARTGPIVVDLEPPEMPAVDRAEVDRKVTMTRKFIVPWRRRKLPEQFPARGPIPRLLLRLRRLIVTRVLERDA